MSSTCQSDHLGRLLGQCQHRMRMVMDRSLRQYGVTPVQCRALMYLHRQPEPVTQRQLEQYMAVKPSTINTLSLHDALPIWRRRAFSPEMPASRTPGAVSSG